MIRLQLNYYFHQLTLLFIFILKLYFFIFLIQLMIEKNINEIPTIYGIFKVELNNFV